MLEACLVLRREASGGRTRTRRGSAMAVVDGDLELEVGIGSQVADPGLYGEAVRRRFET